MKNTEIFHHLDEVGEFMKIGRKEIVKTIKESVIALEDELEELQDSKESLSIKLIKLADAKKLLDGTVSCLEDCKKSLDKELENQKKECANLQHGLHLMQTEFETAKCEIKKLKQVAALKKKKIAESNKCNKLLRDEVSSVANCFAKSKMNCKQLQTKIGSLDATLRAKCEDIKALGVENETLKAVAAEIQNSFNMLQTSYLSDQGTYSIVETKFDLVSNVLSAKGLQCEAMAVFKNLLDNEFMQFANEESSLAGEAQAVLILQGIERQLQMMVSFSGIMNRNIVAVGGGFSAGKSEFISSFFKDKKIKLPVGIKPVTAIPTYVISGKSNKIKGYSTHGGFVDIAPSMYAQLSHDFVKSFTFNLKDIMPVMAIETPIEKYNCICFVDTPGYNPSNTDGFTDSDLGTAKEYLERSNTLLWLIGLDSNGTIPSSDLDFLENLRLENKQLYIVANKADLRGNGELNDILDVVEEVLDDYDIEYEGICAYSSLQRKEFINRKIPLATFLKRVNTDVEIQSQIFTDLNAVFVMYEDAIKKDIKRIETVQASFKSLELDMLEAGQDINDDKVNDRLEIMRNMFDAGDLKKQLKELYRIRELMLQSVAEIFESISSSSGQGARKNKTTAKAKKRAIDKAKAKKTPDIITHSTGLLANEYVNDYDECQPIKTTTPDTETYSAILLADGYSEDYF